MANKIGDAASRVEGRAKATGEADYSAKIKFAAVGRAAANANAVFNATGKRIRTLPITADKLL